MRTCFDRTVGFEGDGVFGFGTEKHTVIQNVVGDNQGSTLFSGGIVLIATPRANQDGSFEASTNNVVALNRTRGNQPANIVQDAASEPNFFVANR